MKCNAEIREEEARSILGSFLFRRLDVEKRVSVLSGGEKSRLSLVKFLVDPPNLLLMDEPTTHLDLLSVEALVQALKHYEGTLVFISPFQLPFSPCLGSHPALERQDEDFPRPRPGLRPDGRSSARLW